MVVVRRRVGVVAAELPEWLVRYRPEEWCEDPDDVLDWRYFGWHRWLDARAEWAAEHGYSVEALDRAAGGRAWRIA